MLRRALLTVSIALAGTFAFTMAVTAPPALSNDFTNAGVGWPTTPLSTAVGPTCDASGFIPVCAWTAPNYNGTMIAVTPVPSGRCRRIGDYYRYFQSAHNRTRQYARFWETTDCRGQNKLLPPGNAWGYLGFNARSLGGR